MDTIQQLHWTSDSTAWSIGLALATAVNMIGTIKKMSRIEAWDTSAQESQHSLLMQ